MPLTRRATAAALTVESGEPVHVMAGGIGASWHAIGPDAFWYDGLVCRTNRGARGSAFGANPPLHKARAWADLQAHARWLGLSFVRVEVDRRLFEPQRRGFTFDGPEMRTLYCILDTCESLGARVFFTHMHGDVAWNAHPGVNRLQSAPRSVRDFAYGLGALMEHLVRRRRYRCIRWLCISNEPGGPWGWWLGPDGAPASIMPAVRAVRRELDRRGLSLPLSGPDWCTPAQGSPDFEPDDPAVGAFDAHLYGDRSGLELCRPWVARARARGLPFFLSEFGAWVGPNVFTTPNPEGATVACYGAQLINARRVVEGLNMGIDGFSRWSFVNRGDLDGRFQLVRTWDPLRWDYTDRVSPEPVPYFTYGVLSRFMPCGARVLRVRGRVAGVSAAAVDDGGRALTIYLLNRSRRPAAFDLRVEGLSRAAALHPYQVTERAVQRPGFRLEPGRAIGVGPTRPVVHVRLPALSITTLAARRRKHDD